MDDLPVDRKVKYVPNPATPSMRLGVKVTNIQIGAPLQTPGGCAQYYNDVLPLIDALSETHDPSDTIDTSETERNNTTEDEDVEVDGMEDKKDSYWNYKNGEF